MNSIMRWILLLLILFSAIVFRFNNPNWDSNYHLHPDERFLTMVGEAMKVPDSFKDYLDVQRSTFNPNNIGYKFYVYGIFPLVLNKLLALTTGADSYNFFTIQGRILSAFFDFLIVILVYKSAELLTIKFHKANFNKFQPVSTIPFWSAFFYAIAVCPIQASHFFTVDSFLNFFMFASFYCALRKKNFLSAIFFGFALACKVSAFYILPLILFFLFKDCLYKRQSLKDLIKILFLSVTYLIVGYLTLRFSDPYYFQSSNFFDPRLNKLFVDSLKSLTQLSRPDIWYPPAVQWIGKPVSFLLTNLMFFGVGLPYFIFMIIGIGWIISNPHLKSKNYLFSGILLWVLGYFVYQSVQFVKSIRYTIYLYPFFAIFSGIGISKFGAQISKFETMFKLKFLKLKTLVFVSDFILIIFLLLWPIAFTSIYRQKHSRVVASEWVFKNLPNNSTILWEHWDDPLPLSLEKNYGKTFKLEAINVFDPDGPEKMEKIKEQMKRADYYILSSNRGWGSIMDAPTRYPIMSKFYKNLFDGKTNYKKIMEFSAYPELKILNFKFQINDSWSEETFTVYDHPKVLIYKNAKKS
ncbi:hypothetical protein COS51_04160 [Candidatus Roizmanbacteria bacterium CG03_land_8_20_14_0_80_36_21]|uniref:Glycosyltransferase RgtA/B/C/D-like domain-containing protein n=2 Tax=Candidatus Roizmaniibacteriota TaxID=1752723 RepID=A0A2M8KKP8_9BACT|nr:MAG: hypothetical protein COS51_04160 [Candidatus Roizmanbacteria bacterium CG03_land_8_20_14_0_80_36_21]PJC81900.1 MAG: hypothetical protein CO007_02250 [Candidatus Roizmanbacteria bacterium CG_4_8_14_3_um_filter_36_10]PJE60488.1 MAG: hypothetical protein COU86_04190 [Candidatus Roizmanbacteria bacterium CG10_big_fil_rev_8_21_14_0_10_36_26]